MIHLKQYPWLFQKFLKIAGGGHDEKLKNFGKSKKSR